MARPWGLVALLLLIVGTACSSGPEDGSGTVTGVVVVASGDEVVESFVVRHEDGSSVKFVPAEGAALDLDQLRALVVSGDDVTVVFERAADGTVMAVSVERSG